MKEKGCVIGLKLKKSSLEILRGEVVDIRR